MRRMQETTAPQAASKVPPSKEGKWKSKSLLPTKTEGRDGRKEGGREAGTLARQISGSLPESRVPVKVTSTTEVSSRD